MIVVSNSKVLEKYAQGARFISYDDLLKDIFGDGFNESDDVYININDLADVNGMKAEELFAALKEEENIHWFSSNQSAPDFSESIIDEMKDWFDDGEGNYLGESKSQQNVSTGGSIVSEDLNSNDIDPNIQDNIEQLMEESARVDESSDKSVDDENEAAKVIVFGSSKGGTGKTFTALISTYRYAKQHPNKRIALVDFDLIDGQVGISIHRVKPTMRNYYNSYLKGLKDFNTMKQYSVRGNDKYPSNVDFYLAPSNGQVVKDDDFWFNVIENLVYNYDLVVFDTGIDYLNIRPIAYAYMSADKINLVTTTSIKSVTSVVKQISKLKGETPNNTYKEEDNIGQRLNVIITQMIPEDEMNKTIYKSLSSKANVIATFGVITSSVSRAEFYGEWNVFDNNQAINKVLDDIMSLE